MGVATDKSLVGLTTAVNNISTSGMSDTTGQAINNTLGTLMTNTTGQAINTTLQSLVGAILPSANNVSFDNTGTGMSASNVQGAIEEVVTTSTVDTGITGVIARKCGNVVQLTISGNITASTAGWVTLGTLPVGLRPNMNYLGAAFDNNMASFASSSYTNLNITTTGEIKIWMFSDKLSLVTAVSVTYLI